MKKLNIAFIWHFHQPNYQDNYDGDFYLPWVRLHASKDYLDMLKRIDKFSNIKLNFNFSPVLLSALQKYLEGKKDLHLEIFLKDENELTQKDKIFILNNYFDLNYKNMVLKRPYFTELYNKRIQAEEINTDIFSIQEYFDIMTNFTLLWIDETFLSEYKNLKSLFEKEKNYTKEDRLEIYQIQLDIIKRILEEYKNYQDEKKIEILTSPYYHPILPLLFDFKNKEIKNQENLDVNFSRQKDAQEQIIQAKEKYFEIFKTNPRGMWLSEQCVCPKTLNLISKMGFNWTVLDEGILSKTIKKEFIRDFEGNLENPLSLNVNYELKSKNPINILFADAFFANLLNFAYGNYDYKIAANDMYDKIKTIQAKLQTSPVENHILTIALDGENCWETYQNDGNEFLDTLYELISNDETLETVLVNDFIEQSKPQELDTIKSGSWINRNFDLWIGEPTKNAAWLYLSSVCKDFEDFKKKHSKKTDKETLEKIKKAYREILISQGSDWYWWYGEPNESKSDGIFDYLFRRHLMNVYEFLGLKVPDYLKIPLSTAQTNLLAKPKKNITPSLSCEIEKDTKEWENSGYIFTPDSPTSNISRLIKNINFGYDDENLYLRFELNKNSFKLKKQDFENQIAIYFTSNNQTNFSSVRFINKNDNVYPIVKNKFNKEVRFVVKQDSLPKLYFVQALERNLWAQGAYKNSKINQKDEIIELKISFSDLDIKNEEFSYFIMEITNEVINEVYPKDTLISHKI